jgi:hypothetical protein
MGLGRDGTGRDVRIKPTRNPFIRSNRRRARRHRSAVFGCGARVVVVVAACSRPVDVVAYIDLFWKKRIVSDYVSELSDLECRRTDGLTPAFERGVGVEVGWKIDGVVGVRGIGMRIGMVELGVLVPDEVGREVDEGLMLMVVGAMVDVEKVSERTTGKRRWLIGLGAARTLLRKSVERRVSVYILEEVVERRWYRQWCSVQRWIVLMNTYISLRLLILAIVIKLRFQSKQGGWKCLVRRDTCAVMTPLEAHSNRDV